MKKSMRYGGRMNRAQRAGRFVSALHAWYVRHKRDLPWRDLQDADKDLRAYKVMVSEVMLQQTQVPRVMVKYKEFVQTFPSLQALSKAKNREILIAWRGMGYNSRALRLRDAARTIVEEHGGRFPREMKGLLSIKGLGPYTVAAIRNFAFDLPTALIDTNVRRVIHRAFVGPEHADGTWQTDDKVLLKICDQVLQQWIGLGHKSSSLFSALMDYGSLVQTKRSPRWEQCVLSAEGIMKTTKRTYERSLAKPVSPAKRQEPGRVIGGRFTPNRIVRGRIVEALRDAPKGMTLEELGSHVAIDWNPQKHGVWLHAIIEKLMNDRMVHIRGRTIRLA